MFISSQSKLSVESKKFFNKSYQANWPKGGYGIKSQNYAVIWSQMFILSQIKLSIKSKKFFDKVLKLTNLNEDIEEKVKIMKSFGNNFSFPHNLNYMVAFGYNWLDKVKYA